MQEYIFSGNYDLPEENKVTPGDQIAHNVARMFVADKLNEFL